MEPADASRSTGMPTIGEREPRRFRKGSAVASFYEHLAERLKQQWATNLN
jgi:hypothetical protein